MYYLRLICKDGKTELHTFENIEDAKGFADASANSICEAWILSDPTFVGHWFYEELYAVWHCDYSLKASA